VVPSSSPAFTHPIAPGQRLSLAAPRQLHGLSAHHPSRTAALPRGTPPEHPRCVPVPVPTTLLDAHYPSIPRPAASATHRQQPDWPAVPLLPPFPPSPFCTPPTRTQSSEHAPHAPRLQQHTPSSQLPHPQRHLPPNPINITDQSHDPKRAGPPDGQTLSGVRTRNPKQHLACTILPSINSPLPATRAHSSSPSPHLALARPSQSWAFGTVLLLPLTKHIANHRYQHIDGFRPQTKEPRVTS
jgi:hypothetical protein